MHKMKYFSMHVLNLEISFKMKRWWLIYMAFKESFCVMFLELEGLIRFVPDMPYIGFLNSELSNRVICLR